MKIQVKIDGIDTFVERDLCPKAEDGREIKNLLSSMTDGLYDIDMKAEQAEAIENSRYDIEKEIIKKLDLVAKSYRYDDMKSARSSASVPLDGTETDIEIAIYNEAVSLGRWDRAVWGKSTDIEKQVLNGDIAMPSSNPDDDNYIWNYLPSYGA